MLAVMCLIPVATIAVLWQYLPPVYEGQLNAHVYTEGLPGKAFYSVDYYKRPEFEGGFLIVQNQSDQDWTCLLYTSPSPRDKRQSRMPSSA